MSIHPYDCKYLDEVMSGLGDIFDLALRQKNIDPDVFVERFVNSKVAVMLEQGSLMYLDGCSVQESLSMIMGYDVVQDDYVDFLEEYWAGFILALLQWTVNRSFKYILGRVQLKEILSMHHVYHEMGEESAVKHLVDRLDIQEPLLERRLQLGLTQQELADFSDVNVRNIRAYEQGQNDISKASAETLYNLSRALGCTMEYLITGS